VRTVGTMSASTKASCLGMVASLVLSACAADGGSGSTIPLPGGGAGQVSFPIAGSGAPGVGVGAAGAATSPPAPGANAGAGGRIGVASAGAGGVSGTVASAGRGTAGGSAGAAGMTPTGGTGDPSACPPAPAGSSDASIAALNAVNAIRVPAGSGCATMNAALNMSALNHCNYYATNKADMMCIADPHAEVMSCMGFTGAGLGQRMMAAGYTGRGGSEVMAFVNNPMSAVDTWVNSVWHRIPTLDPWTTELGYGAATGCDTIDFGGGASTVPKDTVVVYPYNGQTGVPTSFDGSHEGPMPPAPSTGWPSSSPINIYAQALVVSEHVLTVDGSTTPLDHVWLDTNAMVDAGVKGFLRNTAFMYGNAAFMANTKYHVKITGTHTGGAVNLEWTFTTGAASRFGR
jgi:uncharacterized protein YkwD